MQLRKEISAVITCGNWLNFEQEIEKIEKNGIEYIHVDVMDGTLVPNYMVGTDMVRHLHRRTRVPLDIHLMAVRPEDKVAYFELRDGDLFSFHLDESEDPVRCIREIHKRGAGAGVSLSPELAVEALAPYLNELDYVNLMCVRPGFPGQKILPGSRERLILLRELLLSSGRRIPIEVDGNVSFQNAEWMSGLGAEIFAAGSSSIYALGNFSDNVLRMREVIGRASA